MTDTTQNPNAAAAAQQAASPSPASVEAAEAKANEASVNRQNQTAQKEADAGAAITRSPATRQAVAEQKSGALSQRSSNLITNPSPAFDPDAPVVEAAPSELPQSTIDEMEAGRNALKRNKPVAVALEEARDKKDREAADARKA